VRDLSVRPPGSVGGLRHAPEDYSSLKNSLPSTFLPGRMFLVPETISSGIPARRAEHLQKCRVSLV